MQDKNDRKSPLLAKSQTAYKSKPSSPNYNSMASHQEVLARQWSTWIKFNQQILVKFCCACSPRHSQLYLHIIKNTILYWVSADGFSRPIARPSKKKNRKSSSKNDWLELAWNLSLRLRCRGFEVPCLPRFFSAVWRKDVNEIFRRIISQRHLTKESAPHTAIDICDVFFKLNNWKR